MSNRVNPRPRTGSDNVARRDRYADPIAETVHVRALDPASKGQRVADLLAVAATRLPCRSP